MKSMAPTKLFVLLCLLVAGCDSTPSSGLRTIPVPIGTRTFTLEIAETPEASRKGLMERDELPADHGMIFIFTNEAPRGFWMHHTRFPLDIIFLDQKAKVVSIKAMKAYDEHTTSSDAPARYAIELNKGAAADAGVKVGDAIALPPEVTSSKGAEE